MGLKNQVTGDRVEFVFKVCVSCVPPWIMLTFDIVYVWIYYAGGQGAIILFNGSPSPTEAKLEANATEGGIAFQLCSEDMSLFSFSFFCLFPHSGNSVG